MVNTTELMHHGIIGQKWGIRRFQNKDGSLTTAGKRRVISQKTSYKTDGSTSTETTYADPKNGGKFVTERRTYSPSDSSKSWKSIQNAGNDASRALTAASKSISDIKKANPKRINLRKMSDRQLEQRVKRMSLERQYSDLMTDKTNSGKIHVEDVLNIAGTVTAIGASAVGIAIGIKALKG